MIWDIYFNDFSQTGFQPWKAVMDLLSLAHEVSTINTLRDRERFQVSVVVATNVTVFWNATTFSPMESYQNFWAKFCLILRGEEISSPLRLYSYFDLGVVHLPINGFMLMSLLPDVCTKLHLFTAILKGLRGGDDKSLARPGRKQATTNKLGIYTYSTYSPRSSIHSLARCSNFCKPLKKKSDRCPSNQVSAAEMTASDEKWRPFNCFFFSPGNRW